MLLQGTGWQQDLGCRCRVWMPPPAHPSALSFPAIAVPNPLSHQEKSDAAPCTPLCTLTLTCTLTRFQSFPVSLAEATPHSQVFHCGMSRPLPWGAADPEP